MIEQLEDLPGDCGSSHSRSVSDDFLQAEERPLVHEEVNRLPQKYRSPIVLCYFEGLTHDQAAATLGWPVGTVKGRLSRARDLLRARLTRRGVAVSSAVLAAPSGWYGVEGVGSPIFGSHDMQNRNGGCRQRRCRNQLLRRQSRLQLLHLPKEFFTPWSSLTSNRSSFPSWSLLGFCLLVPRWWHFSTAVWAALKALARAVPKLEVEELPMPGNLAPVTRVPVHAHKQGIPTRQAGPSHRGTRRLEEAAEVQRRLRWRWRWRSRRRTSRTKPSWPAGSRSLACRPWFRPWKRTPRTSRFSRSLRNRSPCISRWEPPWNRSSNRSRTRPGGPMERSCPSTSIRKPSRMRRRPWNPA